MEKENFPCENILESMPESKLNKMADELDWLGSTMGIEIKEGDYLLKSEEEFSDGDGESYNICTIEGELNGKGLKISKETTSSEWTGKLQHRISLSERTKSKEEEGYEYVPVWQVEKEESMKREDLLSQYKRKKNIQDGGSHVIQMRLFYEKLSQEKEYKELHSLYEALEKAAITVNKDES